MANEQGQPPQGSARRPLLEKVNEDLVSLNETTMKTSTPKTEITSSTRRGFLKTSATMAGTALIGALDVSRFAHAAESSTLKLGLVGWRRTRHGAAGDALTGDPGTKLWPPPTSSRTRSRLPSTH